MNIKNILRFNSTKKPTSSKKSYNEVLKENPFDRPGFAERYVKKTEDDVLHALYERPHTLEFATPYEGNKVLIAGGGPGIYAQTLADSCSMVVSIDVSAEMTKLAQSKLSPPHYAIQADLRDSLPFKNQEFDLVISPLTLHYIENWDQTFAEFYRVLKSQGRMVFSVRSPTADVSLSTSYQEPELVSSYYHDFQANVNFFRRSIDHMLTPLLNTGFTITKIAEPPFPTSAKSKHPNMAKAIHQNPLFIWISLKK